MFLAENLTMEKDDKIILRHLRDFEGTKSDLFGGANFPFFFFSPLNHKRGWQLRIQTYGGEELNKPPETSQGEAPLKLL